MPLILRRLLLSQRFVQLKRALHGKIVHSDMPDVPIPNQTVADFVLERISQSQWENRVAMECAITGRKYTFKQTRDFALNFNRSLRKRLKLQRQDVVAVLLPNVPEFPMVALGILKAGLIATTINPTYTPSEVDKQLKDSGAKLIVTLVDLYPSLVENIQIPIITIKTLAGQATPEGATDFGELASQTCDFPEVLDAKPGDVAVLPYSSGTTGLPKGVRLLHSNILANILQVEHNPDIRMTPRATSNFQAIIPAVLPMFHIYGFTILSMVQLVCGAKTVTLPKFTPETYINTLHKHKCHVLYLVPPIAIFLANHPGVGKAHFDTIETVASGAAPLGGLDEEKLIKKAQKNLRVVQGYGLTETSPSVLCTTKSIKSTLNCPGTIGKPIPNTQVKLIPIDDSEGEPLGPNQQGELWVKGPQVMAGYHNRPKETAETLRNGWLRTGDVMYYDDRGLFYITDRIKELIKVKGYQVAPAELEEILRDHPEVVDAAVFGVPHAQYGEVPKAVVVLKAGARVKVGKIEEFVNGKVASYKRVSGGIVVSDSIPKNATGKILRRELKLKYS